MILKYEKEVEDDQGEDDNSKKFIKVDKNKATHIHKCRHDEDPQGPCSREEI